MIDSPLPSDDHSRNGNQPTALRVPLARAARRGALFGLVVGLVALGSVLAVVGQCLPFQISFPPPPWPWYCSDLAYGVIGYLAFPVNLITTDLARAVPLAPLSLLMYVFLGMLVGLALGASRSGSPRK